MIRALAVLALLTLGPPVAARAAELSGMQISTEAKKSIVYIATRYYDPNTDQTKDGDVGTGMIVSADGYVLTDYHVIQDWLSQDQEHRDSAPILARVGSKFGPIVDVLVAASNQTDDLVLLKIRNDQSFTPVSFCFLDKLETAEPIYAFGFANGEEFTPVPVGTFTNANSNDGRWQASFNNAHGMSGGPIYDRFGSVVGIIRSTLESQNATNYVTPALWARQLIQSRTTALERCDPERTGVELQGAVQPAPQPAAASGSVQSIWLKPDDYCTTLQSAVALTDKLNTLHYATNGKAVARKALREEPISESPLFADNGSSPVCGISASAPRALYCTVDLTQSLSDFQGAFRQSVAEVDGCLDQQSGWQKVDEVLDCMQGDGLAPCSLTWSKSDGHSAEIFSFSSQTPTVWGIGVDLAIR